MLDRLEAAFERLSAFSSGTARPARRSTTCSAGAGGAIATAQLDQYHADARIGRRGVRAPVAADRGDAVPGAPTIRKAAIDRRWVERRGCSRCSCGFASGCRRGGASRCRSRPAGGRSRRASGSGADGALFVRALGNDQQCAALRAARQRGDGVDAAPSKPTAACCSVSSKGRAIARRSTTSDFFERQPRRRLARQVRPSTPGWGWRSSSPSWTCTVELMGVPQRAGETPYSATCTTGAQNRKWRCAIERHARRLAGERLTVGAFCLGRSARRSPFFGVRPLCGNSAVCAPRQPSPRRRWLLQRPSDSARLPARPRLW